MIRTIQRKLNTSVSIPGYSGEEAQCQLGLTQPLLESARTITLRTSRLASSSLGVNL